MSCRKAVLVVAALTFASVSQAQATLYDDLGGPAGMDRIVDNAIKHFLADPRISKTFDDTNMVRFRKMLTEQLCQVAEGPCSYSGHSMSVAHKGLELHESHFNALVEDMQGAMDDSGVSFHTQNRLLQRLASMERDVVTK